MPKVMMISGVKALGAQSPRLPNAGAYRPPIGRVLNGAPRARGVSGSAIRRELMAPLLSGAGVGMQYIPGRTRNELIPGAMRLPTLRGAHPQMVANRAVQPLRVPQYVRRENIPGAVRLPRLGYLPGQNQLPVLRGLAGAGLGDVNMCTDPAAVFMNNILGTAGAVMQTVGGAQTTTTSGGWVLDPQTGQYSQGAGTTSSTPDAGWVAAGGATMGAANAWQTACAGERAAASGDPTELANVQAQLEIERYRREADGQYYQQSQWLQAQQNQQNQQNQSAPMSDNMKYGLAAGVAVGVGALAYMVFGKKRRR